MIPVSAFFIILLVSSSGEAGRPPRLIESPADSVVPRNEALTLNCRADGDPPPQVSWLKDRKPIRPDHRGGLRSMLPSGALFFLRVQGKDAGVYNCVGTNSFGEAVSRNATLDVATLRDEFRASPQNTWVAQGDTAVLECEPPRGNPEPKVAWKKNGNPIDIKTNGRYKLVGQGSLSISQVRQTDEGRYLCVAKNIVGSRQSNTALLRVTLRPQFTIRPANTSALLGGEVSLSCVARGDPPPEITWIRQGGNLPLKRVHFDEERFLISNVSQVDDGVYVCVAENKAGSITSSASVTVLPLPILTVVPTNIEIQPNSTAYFGCEGKGDPSPTLFWLKEGGHSIIFQGSRVEKMQVTPEGTLQIDNVSERDEGFYLCAAVSQAGSVIHRVHLKVTPVEELPPPIVNIGPSNLTRSPGSVAILPCIANGNPPPVITWYKDGDSFLLNHRVFTDDAGTLRITDVEESDTGMYECVASSRSGKYVWKSQLTVVDRTRSRIGFGGGDNSNSNSNSFDLIGGSRPEAPLKPWVVKVDSSSVTIAWHPHNQLINPNSFDESLNSYNSFASEFQQRRSLIIGEDDRSKSASNGQGHNSKNSQTAQNGRNGQPNPFPRAKSTLVDEDEQDGGMDRHPSYIDDDDSEYYTDEFPSKKRVNDKGQREKRASQMDQSVFPNRFLLGGRESDQESEGGGGEIEREKPSPSDPDGDRVGGADGESNGFGDMVSQIIEEDRAKEDEYDYTDEYDDEETSGSNSNSNLVIQSSKIDSSSNDRKGPDTEGLFRFFSATSSTTSTRVPSSTTTETTTTTTTTPVSTTIPTTTRPTTKAPAIKTFPISNSNQLSLIAPSKGNSHHHHSNSLSSELTYKVEYYSADEVKNEWLLGATNVPMQTFTLDHLKPNTEYIFFVRSVKDGIVSGPSPPSDPVRTTHSGTRTPELAQAREKLAGGIIAILKNVYATSSTAIRIEWQIVSSPELVEGFYIYYRRVDINDDIGSYQMLTVLNAGAATFQIVSLDKFATYQIFLVPFFKNVEGRPSNYVNVSTLEDVPSAAPELIEPVPVNNSALIVRWRPPPVNYHNGVILGYQLRVWQGSSLVGNKTVDGLTYSVVLNNLHSGQSYSLQIGSFTSRGVGVFSPMRLLHFRPDPSITINTNSNNNQMSNSINTYNPDGGEKNDNNNHKNTINSKEGRNEGNNQRNRGGDVEDNLIPEKDDDFVTSDIAFGGASATTNANPHHLFSEAWFIALIGCLVFAMMLVFVFALYLRRCQLQVEGDKLKVSTTEIPDGSIPPHYPDDNLWIDAAQHKQQLSLKSIKTAEMMNDYENANNYAVVEERHSPIAYATTTLVNNNGQKHKSSFSVFGDSIGSKSGLGGREFGFGCGSNKIVGGWNPLAQPNNNKTASLNISSQDIKKPPWLMTSAQNNCSTTQIPLSGPCSSQSSSSHSSASSEALMKLNPKPKLSLKSSSTSDNSNKSRRRGGSRPSSRGQGRDDEYLEDPESFCLTDAQGHDPSNPKGSQVLTTFQTPLPTRKHLIVDYNSGSQLTNSSVLQLQQSNSRLNNGVNSIGSNGGYEYSSSQFSSHYAHPSHPSHVIGHGHHHPHNPY